jgi:predicted NodU family carbamoyl transferase
MELLKKQNKTCDGIISIFFSQKEKKIKFTEKKKSHVIISFMSSGLKKNCGELNKFMMKY